MCKCPKLSHANLFCVLVFCVINPLYLSLCSSFVYRPYHFLYISFVSFVFRFCFQCCCTRIKNKPFSTPPHTHQISEPSSVQRTNPHLPLKQRKHIPPNSNAHITVPIPNSTPPLPSERHLSQFQYPVMYIYIYKVDSCFLHHLHLPYHNQPKKIYIYIKQNKFQFSIYFYIFFVFICIRIRIVFVTRLTHRPPNQN